MGHMLFLVLAMLLSLGLAVTVLFVVAIPARRQGRDVLTPKGEDVVSMMREKTGEALDTAREKTSEALDVAREKVSEVTRTNEN
jgi:competence protein ComGC